MSLKISGKVVPLLGVSVKAEVAEIDGSVILTQTFGNPSFETKGEPQEAVYNFPLQSSSAVYSFKSTFYDAEGKPIKTMIGKALEKEEAREKYEEAKANGKSAQLLEVDYSTSPDVFVVSIGNIENTCKSVVVDLGYYVPMTTEEKGKVKRFMIPSVLTPKYGEVVPKVFGDVNVNANGAKFEVVVNVAMESPISMIESPSHKVTTKLNVDGSSHKANVSFTQEEFLSKNFVLKLSSSGQEKSSLLIQNPETIENKAFLESFGDVTIGKLKLFVDEREEEQEPEQKNFVFVVDRSGSMGGNRMENCKKALQLCINALPENCLFNICSFGSSFNFLFPESAPYSDETLEKAKAHVKGMSANMGGTNILGPILEVLKQANEKVPTVVFVMTDGDVSNSAEIIKQIKTSRAKFGTSVFSCGIGAGASTHLVEGLSKAGEGTSTFIADGERMNAKLAAQMEQSISDPFKELKINLGPLTEAKAKFSWKIESSLPASTFPGKFITAFVALENNTVAELSKSIKEKKEIPPITLLAKDANGKEIVIGSCDVSTNCLITGTNLVVPALRAEVAKVEERVTDKKSAKKRATRLAVCANIVTKYTSLVAVAEGEDVKSAKPIEIATKPVPAPELAVGMSYGSRASLMAPPPPSAPRRMMKFAGGGMKMGKKKKNQSRKLKAPLGMDMSLPAPAPALSAPMAFEKVKELEMEDDEDIMFKDEGREVAPVLKKMSDVEILETLVDLQKSNGWFEDHAKILPLTGKSSLADYGTDKESITALAIALMEIKLGHMKSEWKILKRKAVNYLKKNAKEHEKLLEKARTFLNA